MFYACTVRFNLTMNLNFFCKNFWKQDHYAAAAKSIAALFTITMWANDWYCTVFEWDAYKLIINRRTVRKGDSNQNFILT